MSSDVQTPPPHPSPPPAESGLLRYTPRAEPPSARTRLRAEAAELARLAELDSFAVLDTPPEQGFDDIACLAALVCQTPSAQVTFVDHARQWFKARVGGGSGGACETGREIAFCDQTIRQSELFVVPDARLDARYAANPLVTGPPHIRFYAGAPLVTPGGHALGSVCVTDTVPQTLTPAQRNALGALARQAVALLLLRRQHLSLEQSREQTRAAKRLFRSFMDNSPTVAFIKDDAGRYVFLNATMCRRFGIAPEEWIGKGDADLWPADAARQFREADAAVMAGGRLVELVEVTPHPDGSASVWQSFKFPITEPDGRRFLAGVALDITERRAYERELLDAQTKLREANAQLHDLAHTDALTGLANRLALEARLAAAFGSSRQHGRPLSAVMIDVDHFKQFNDRFGHPAGDGVLREVARLLSRSVRGGDTAGRYGGEEFLVVLPEADRAGARSLAERIRHAVAATSWPLRAITVSVGTATLTADVPDWPELVSRADQALYRAKREGRDRVAEFGE